jgi:hypothetical protein
MELKTIGGHIPKRRLDLGLLQKEVALRISVDKTAVMNWIIAQEARPASTGGREHALALTGQRCPQGEPLKRIQALLAG